MIKTPEFLDAMCKSWFLNKNWMLIDVEGYGSFVWREDDPDSLFKIYCLELWMETNKLVRETEPVNCQVRNIISKKASIRPMDQQPIELWLNIVIPFNADDNIRVEPYLDQGDALTEAEQELVSNFEVHTKRIVIKIP